MSNEVASFTVRFADSIEGIEISVTLPIGVPAARMEQIAEDMTSVIWGDRADLKLQARIKLMQARNEAQLPSLPGLGGA